MIGDPTTDGVIISGDLCGEFTNSVRDSARVIPLQSTTDRYKTTTLDSLNNIKEDHGDKHTNGFVEGRSFFLFSDKLSIQHLYSLWNKVYTLNSVFLMILISYVSMIVINLMLPQTRIAKLNGPTPRRHSYKCPQL